MNLRCVGLLAILVLPLGCGAAPSKGPAEPTGGTFKETEGPMGGPASPIEAAPPQEEPETKNAEDEKSVPGKAVVSEPLGGGYLSQADIRNIVMKNAELFDECYSIGAGKSRQFVATVTVRATIGPTGKVQVTKITKTTARNKKVDTCVEDAFKKIQFPKPKGAATSVITFPMEFNGAEEVQQ